MSKFTPALAHYRTRLTHQARNAVTISPTHGTHHPWDEEKRRRYIPLQNVSNYLHYWIRLKREHMYTTWFVPLKPHPTASGNRTPPIPNLCWVLSLPAPWKLSAVNRRKITALFSQVSFPSTSWRVAEHKPYPSMSINLRDVRDTDTPAKTGKVALWRTTVVANVCLVSCLWSVCMPDALQTWRGLLKNYHKVGAGPPPLKRLLKSEWTGNIKPMTSQIIMSGQTLKLRAL